MIGGGTGSPHLLLALRERLPQCRFSIVVPVTDTGRSTGVVRRTLRVPGPGDLRHCLSTLATDGSVWSRLLERRLAAPEYPDLDGMALGNLVLGGLAQQTGNLAHAASMMAEMLDVRERVLPVSVEDIHLDATLEDGVEVFGELEVRRPGKPPIRQLHIRGSVEGVWPETAEALRSASALILGPGSLWTSLGGVLAVPGVREAVLSGGAQVVFVCNTTTQPGQTDGSDVIQHVAALAELLGRDPDVVILNGGRLEPDEEGQLAQHGLHLLLPDDRSVQHLESRGVEVVTGDLLSRHRHPTHDLWHKLHTAYHDMDRLADVVLSSVVSSRLETQARR